MSGSFKKKRILTKESISNPQNFIHLEHVGFDQRSSFSVEKLDEKWKQLIQSLKNRKQGSAALFAAAAASSSSSSPSSSPSAPPKPRRQANGKSNRDDDHAATASAAIPEVRTRVDKEGPDSADRRDFPSAGDEEGAGVPTELSVASELPFDEDPVTGCLSSNDKFRLSVIWNLLTNEETPAEGVVSGQYETRIRALEAEVGHMTASVKQLSEDKEQLGFQLGNLEAENAAVRSQCAGLKKENSTLNRQYGHLRSAKEDVDKKAGDMVRKMELKASDFEITGEFSDASLSVGKWCGASVALHTISAESHLDLLLTCGQFSHPHILSVFGFLSQPDYAQVVAEMMESCLSKVIAAALDSDRYLTKREQIDLAIDCASAVSYLHSIPHIHGNVCTNTVQVNTHLTAKLSLLHTPSPADAEDKSISAELNDLGMVLGEIISGLQSSNETDMVEIITDTKLKHVCTSLLTTDRPMAAKEALVLLQEQTEASRYQRSAAKRMIQQKNGSEVVFISK
eukprot:m.7435 g.7435  ORF g.7435 m.7435 type:complete len:511 (+) comp18668_c0_seq1:120-1652(+)